MALPPNGSAACQSGVCVPVTPPACDDHDVCNGVETCVPASGCKAGTPLTCDDADVCDGLETCNPTSGCKSGTPLDCDDQDECTTETCDAVSGCSSSGPSGLALAQCRLQGVRNTVAKASGTDINPSIRTKLLRKLDGVDGRINSAAQATGNTKKIRKSLKAAGRQLQAAIRFVTKMRGKKVTADTADALLGALSALPPLVAAQTL